MLALGSQISGRIQIQELERASACRFTIVRLPAEGGDPEGGVDTTSGTETTGTYLHCRAQFPVISSGTLLDPPDPDSVPPLLDWDPDGTEMLPKGCTLVTLVGGSGRWGVIPVMTPLPAQAYKAQERQLLRVVPTDTTFVVPPGHTQIGTLDATASLANLSDGTTLRLTAGWPNRIISGTRLRNTGAPVQVWTGFKA